MIDAFTLLLSHGLILIAAWRLLPRADLDHDMEVDEASSGMSSEVGGDA